MAKHSGNPACSLCFVARSQKFKSKAADKSVRPTRGVIPQSSFGEEVVEGFYGGKLIVFDVEDGVELGDVKDVVNFLGEVEELEFSAGIADGGKAADQFADAGGIDVIDVGEVEDDFFLAGGDELADGVTKLAGFVAESDASVDVDDSDVANFAGGDGHGSSGLGSSVIGLRLRRNGRVRGGAKSMGRAAKC
jgi:hypothetical protein